MAIFGWMTGCGSADRPVDASGTPLPEPSFTTAPPGESPFPGIEEGPSGQWVNRTPEAVDPTWPEMRVRPLWAYDGVRHRSLLLGGVDRMGGVPQTMHAWDGATNTWSDETPYPTQERWAPIGEDEPSTFDRKEHRLVVSFEGYLWSFDGSHWQNLQERLPNGFNATAITYDTDHDAVLLIGSRRLDLVGDATRDEMWSFDPTSHGWTLASVLPTFATRVVTMVYVEHRHTAVFATEENTSTKPDLDKALWEWDSQTGSVVRLTQGPLPETPSVFTLRWPQLVYNPMRKVVLLIGGYDSDRTVVEFGSGDGSWKSRKSVGFAPPALAWGTPGVFDDARGKVTLISVGKNTSWNISVWEWDAH